MRPNIFNRLSFLSLFSVIVLLPVFCLPYTSIPVETSKGLLLVIGLALSFVFWALARFFDGKIILPKSNVLLAGGGVVLAFLLSATFSVSKSAAFFGTMFDIGTFWFILAGFLLMLLSSIVFRDPKSAKIVLFGAIISSAVVLIFQSVRLFIPEILSLGVLGGKTGNLLGSWNAFGIFAGFSVLMSLLVIEFFSTTKSVRWLLQILTVLSLVLVAVVNFPLVWVFLGISGLMIFIYKVSVNSGKSQAEQKKTRFSFPIFSFIVIMAALLFFMSGTFIGGVLPSRLGIQNNELSPSFGTTMQVTKSVLKAKPILGLGPNRFGEAWAMYKPSDINYTTYGIDFWDIAFNSGSGLLPTLASTTGYLGILALLTFLILFIMSGAKSVFSGIKNGVNWERMAFFVLSLYLFIASFFYSTGVVLFLLAFAFAGVYIGLSASDGAKGKISISFLNDHRKSFFSILSIVLIIILSVAISFKYLERLASVVYFGKAVSAPNIPVAEASIGKAIALHQNDLYLRTYAQIYLVKLSELAKNTPSPQTDADKADLQARVDGAAGQAVTGAKLATLYDEKNYINFQALGSLYQNLASFGLKDANNLAVDAYKSASALNPLNPGLKLSMATASLAGGKTAEAKDFAKAALDLKHDYIDALITLSQIAKNEADNAAALSYAQTALEYVQIKLSSFPFDENLLQLSKNLTQYIDSLKTPGSSDAAVPSGTNAPTDATPKSKDSSAKENQ